jgi:hypothetical protein
MDKTGVMLSMLGSVKVFVSRDDVQGYRGASVKRTIVTAIECISTDSRLLLEQLDYLSDSWLALWIFSKRL